MLFIYQNIFLRDTEHDIRCIVAIVLVTQINRLYNNALLKS